MLERPDALVRTAGRAFEDRFGKGATWFVAAPGRVNLIGEHTDYNEGFVLPMAIERHTVIAAALAGSSQPARLRLHSEALDASADIALDAPQRPRGPPWSNYVRGVVAGFQQRGGRIPSLYALIASDVPLGSGLSSSAALEVATATLLETVTGMTLDPVDKARLCQKAEHEFAHVPCGLMDQLVSILGLDKGPMLIDCRSEETRNVSLADGAACIVIANSNVRHSLGDGAYARRRAECENAARHLGVASLRDATVETVDAARHTLGPILYRRARHIVTENARTLEAARALAAGDVRAAGSLFYDSHRSLRDDYEVSCTELDVLVDVARELGERSGVYGARMTGAGFGGCTVTLVKAGRGEEVSRELQLQYQRRTGHPIDAFVTRPARGARRVGPSESE
jgi:galactokinase